MLLQIDALSAAMADGRVLLDIIDKESATFSGSDVENLNNLADRMQNALNSLQKGSESIGIGIVPPLYPSEEVRRSNTERAVREQMAALVEKSKKLQQLLTAAEQQKQQTLISDELEQATDALGDAMSNVAECPTIVEEVNGIERLKMYFMNSEFLF